MHEKDNGYGFAQVIWDEIVRDSPFVPDPSYGGKYDKDQQKPTRKPKPGKGGK